MMAQTKKGKDSTPRLQQQENLQLLVTRSANSKSHNSRIQSTSRSRSRNRCDGPMSKRPRVRSKSPVNDDQDDMEKDEKPIFTRRRCRDYDERGFCMRGDFCKYDHGSDPVVLDASSVLGLAANGAPAHLTATQSISNPGSTNYLNEPYNPEAPGIIDSKPINAHGNRRGSIVSSVHHISQHQFWRPMPPGSSSNSFIPSMNQTNRPRELVGVPTLSESGGKNSTSSSINNPDSSKLASMDTSTTSSSSTNMVNSGSNSHHHHNNSSINKRGNAGRGGLGGHRGGFRWGFNKRVVNNESADKCTLEVRKIPPNLNTISHLNSHFSKFGSIVNLQVCYDGDPEAALIQFASHSEALAAHRCTEAVLNNRFIKVFWHSKDQSQQQSLSHSSPNQGPGHHPHSHHHLHHHKSSYDSNLRASGGSSNGITANDLNKSDQINSSRLNVKERLGLRQPADSNSDRNSTNVTSSGALSRTVFNHSLLKKQYPSSTSSAGSSSTTINPTINSNVSTSGIKQEATDEPPATTSSNPVSSETVIRSKEEGKKNKLLKMLELQKKRQNILVSYMQQQIKLIEKLQKAKTDKDKGEIRSTLDAISKQIKDLESVIKKDAENILAETLKLPSSSKINNKIQMEKELLDVEMDFYNELHKGASASDLHKKLQEIKMKAKSYCMNDIRSTKAMIKRFADMKAALRDRNRQANHNLVRNLKNLRKVDRRTRKIFIEGIPEDDNSILLAHLSQSVEIESLESMPQGVLVTFKTRRDAEMALPLISTIPTKATWFDDVKAKPDESEIAPSPKPSSEFETLNESEMNTENDESAKIKTEDESGIGGRYFDNIEGSKDDDDDDDDEDTMDEEEEHEMEDRPSIKQETSSPDELQLNVGAEDNLIGDEETEEDESTTKQDDETSSPDELELSIGIEDDLLEEEETEDEDENRAWRR